MPEAHTPVTNGASGMTGSVRAGSLTCKAGRSQAYPSELEKATEAIGAGTCRLCTLARGSDKPQPGQALPLAKRQRSAALPIQC